MSQIDPSPQCGCSRELMDRTLRQWLQPQLYKDYCPNGLQLEGVRDLHKVATAVTASLEAIESAADWGAQALIVHHGLFWRGDDPCLTGMLGHRVRRLMQHGINLWAFHLPLDHHATLGNNAQWASKLGWIADGRFGDEGIGWLGQLAGVTPLHAVAQQIERLTGRPALSVGDPDRSVLRLAWCTGGAQKMLDAAAAQGVDLYVSGEISEPTYHAARELGVAYIAAGHHATERYGVQALGQALADQLGVEHSFIDSGNPA